ncbi:transposase [Micromonospora sp. WMMA1363]|uniref:transposase n=1 Tax=Micromonospora sp. WMMA1363 TaxID=3053985 RepID=UPI00259D2E72|nr:transposase [Micromonospora sp. WMMA1363]MDM4721537.1 transposase [Micromonospora sp. WMMA1363]
MDVGDSLELLAEAPDPAAAAKLSGSQISAALKRARRRDIPTKAAAIQAALRTEQLGQPDVLTAAYAATVRALVALLGTLNKHVKALQGQVEDHFGRHPAAEIILSQPGLGVVLGARVLAEFGDDHDRYASAKARRNYAGTSPITRASGKKRAVMARFVHNDRLVDALITQAFSALKASPGARAYYDRQRACGANHSAALRQLANRLVGILHGCLKTDPASGVPLEPVPCRRCQGPVTVAGTSAPRLTPIAVAGSGAAVGETAATPDRAVRYRIRTVRTCVVITPAVRTWNIRETQSC